MSFWLKLLFAAAILITLLLLALHPVGRWAALVILLVNAAALLIGWSRARGAVRAAYQRPTRWSWTDEPPAPLDGRSAEVDADWQALGYHRIGCLRQGETGCPFLLVYTHATLPAYAVVLAGRGPAQSPVSSAWSFFDGGGRITTTGSRMAALTAWLPSEAPRLVQLRPGGSPKALDGQHVGTLSAWSAGGRQPLPATKEALIPYLEADERAMAAALAAAGWLPLPHYLRYLVGAPAGVLEF
jgi:hypothetical protein